MAEMLGLSGKDLKGAAKKKKVFSYERIEISGKQSLSKEIEGEPKEMLELNITVTETHSQTCSLRQTEGKSQNIVQKRERSGPI